MNPSSKPSLDEQLLKIRREAEERDAQTKAQKAGLNYLNLATAPIQVEALKLVAEERARRLRVAPFQLKGKELALAVLDPGAAGVKELVQELASKSLAAKIFIVSASSLTYAWTYYKYVVAVAEEITGKVNIEEQRFQSLYKSLVDLEKVKKEIENFDLKTFHTGQILEVALAGAMANRASDIHFEAEEKGVRLRYRIDGLLHDIVPGLSTDIYKFLLSRIKLLSNLKLNVQDAPQDGRFTIGLDAKQIEIRVSINPSEFGETIVMRVLDPSAIQLSMAQLGLRKDDLRIIEEELKKPNGMILNSGPTGSGKTTTLYAFLLHKRTPETKIITIEDPIEYRLEDIEQTQVKPEAGYTFASGLRSLMRQDPDIILVGEVRDKETAEIGMQAALTGHLVFSTVHANSAAGAIPRLLDLGVKPVTIGPALNLIIAQRLIRRLCECKSLEKASSGLEKQIKQFLAKLPKRVDQKEFQEIRIYKPVGCPRCGGLGYKGRVAVFELLKVDESFEKLIKPEASEGDLHQASLKQGMVTMQQDGILKVIAGMTTFEEVEGATGPLNI
ncbi:MAG: GspE/PulE family protein [Patescibacteria group bacterium]